MTKLPPVLFDFSPEEAVKFKFVLIQVGEKFLVRGWTRAEYHADIVDEFARTEIPAGGNYEVIGGGRIAFDSLNRTILVYGHSIGFPWKFGSRNAQVAEMVKKAFPDFTVESSTGGY